MLGYIGSLDIREIDGTRLPRWRAGKAFPVSIRAFLYFGLFCGIPSVAGSMVPSRFEPGPLHGFCGHHLQTVQTSSCFGLRERGYDGSNTWAHVPVNKVSREPAIMQAAKGEALEYDSATLRCPHRSLFTTSMFGIGGAHEL